LPADPDRVAVLLRILGLECGAAMEPVGTTRVGRLAQPGGASGQRNTV